MSAEIPPPPLRTPQIPLPHSTCSPPPLRPPPRRPLNNGTPPGFTAVESLSLKFALPVMIPNPGDVPSLSVARARLCPGKYAAAQKTSAIRVLDPI